ncbi:unnamed protein product [Schistosoma curassoni]|uniref:G-protein coupled receptors family 1 profile domain-containing protein n=1 Tax=Schistosoma curassoni TaxID=6186 RepID=A0A183JJE0_9TREM|nr:unnamed protein product [Schistosoma curassoni]
MTFVFFSLFFQTLKHPSTLFFCEFTEFPYHITFFFSYMLLVLLFLISI